jgi:predicted dithiol-disulfide oxidoreductase (DUF899 family)
MTYAQTNAKMVALRQEISSIRRRMEALQAEIEPQSVSDYSFQNVAGSVRLSELFGARRELFVIHNMGIGCPNCTVWADGYNGVYPHIASRAGFAVIGPDAPEVQEEVAKKRAWRFPFLSHRGTSFADDMGYRAPNGGFLPGLSVFRKDVHGLVRIGESGLVEPGCDFSPVCRLFEFLPGGSTSNAWKARHQYEDA